MTTMRPREFSAALADPHSGERFSAVTGTPLVTVEVSDSAAAEHLSGIEVTSLPCVIVLLIRDPSVIRDPRALAVADIILTDDAGASRPFVAPAEGARRGLERLNAIVQAHPVAAAALALLLRSSSGLSVPAALVAESSTYSALQAGSEFIAWRATRAARPPDPQSQRVLLDRTDSRLRITLARPSRRNALDAQMRDALTEALALAVVDDGCSVQIDALGPDFCAGGDLDEFGSRPDPAIAHLTRLSRSPARLMHALAERTVVRVHGACLGAGIELPAFAGTVIATSDARFGLPEISLGLVPGAGGTVSLPRRIGRRRTAYLALAGHPINAPQALDWGLIDEIDQAEQPAFPARE